MSHPLLPKNKNKDNALFRQGKPDFSKLEADAFPTPTADEAGSILEETDIGSRYRWSGTTWIQIVQRGAAVVFSQDFLAEVALGNVPGFRLEGIQAQGPADITLGDVWGGPGDLVYPTTAEVWEVASDSINDTDGGTGLRTATVISLDANKLRQFTPVTLDGSTAVVLSGTHIRPHLIVGEDSGSLGFNDGTITVRVQGGGDIRSVMKPNIGISHDSHFTVPSNETGQFVNLFFLVPKNADMSGGTTIRDGSNPNATWIRSIDAFMYQSLVNFEIFARLPLASEADVKARAATSSSTFDITVIFEMLFIEV